MKSINAKVMKAQWPAGNRLAAMWHVAAGVAINGSMSNHGSWRSNLININIQCQAEISKKYRRLASAAMAKYIIIGNGVES
jgi:hypothetical protein